MSFGCGGELGEGGARRGRRKGKGGKGKGKGRGGEGKGRGEERREEERRGGEGRGCRCKETGRKETNGHQFSIQGLRANTGKGRVVVGECLIVTPV